MAKTFDVVIVGGGVIGCAIAYYLGREGVGTVVLEQHRLGSGASGATAGIISPLAYLDFANGPLFEMGMKSRQMFPGLADELKEYGADAGLNLCGFLQLVLSEAGRAGFQFVGNRTRPPWQEMGLSVEWLEGDAVRRLVGEVAPRVLGGFLCKGDGVAETPYFVNALVEGARALGVTFVEACEGGGLHVDGRRVNGVRTADGVYSAGQTVLAAGAWMGIADRWLQTPLPVYPAKGQRLLLKHSGFLPQVVVQSDKGILVPQSDGSVLVGTSRHEGEFNSEVTAETLAGMIGNAVDIFPALKEARFVGAQAGVRPGTRDKMPVLGPVPGWEGLCVASGHDHAGVMLSPATGGMMADYIRTGDAGALAPFALSRFEGWQV